MKKILLIIRTDGYLRLFSRILMKINRLMREFVEFLSDSFRETYVSDDYKNIGFINHILDKNILQKRINNIPDEVLENYLSHQFDLLGSGWTRVSYEMRARGIDGCKFDMSTTANTDKMGLWLTEKINKFNLKKASETWRLIEPKYKAIDWQLDFKSGFRWSEKTWYKHILIGHKKGADVKVPWELSRMQHLPQMALKYISYGEQLDKKKVLLSEFRNQVLDFITTNPPKYGVNWACPMDVAIRASNLLIAYDLFRSTGIDFDSQFKKIFTESIVNHGRNIVSNLEWNKGERANHYIANIAGLAFIAAYLPSNKEFDSWVAFSVQELINEVEHQFYPDGSNFEGSTAYHRLSVEMVIFSTAILLGLSKARKEALKENDFIPFKTGKNKPNLKSAKLKFYELPKFSNDGVNTSPFPAWYFERIEKMIEFIIDITKPNGKIPQIGDNDSGRFFKLNPEYQSLEGKDAKKTFTNLKDYDETPDKEYFFEDHLNCDHIVSAGCALFNRADYFDYMAGRKEIKKSGDYLILKALLGGVVIKPQRENCKQETILFDKAGDTLFRKHLSLLDQHADPLLVHEFKHDSYSLNQNMILKAYPDFGLFIFKSENFFLAVRCWAGREPFHSSHMHFDQLSIELMIDGIEIISDKGSYVYTPLPEEYWKYRSAESHFTPYLSDHYKPEIKSKPFSKIKLMPIEPSYFGNYGFLSLNVNNNPESYYLVHIDKKQLKIYSYGFERQQYLPLNETSQSLGYGILSA